MKNENTNNLFDRYLSQPSMLPHRLRRFVEDTWQEPIVLYAWADLDENLQSAQTWLLLGETKIGVIKPGDAKSLQSFERRLIDYVKRNDELSCTRLVISARKGGEPFINLVFTHRQRIAMSNIQFLLESGVKTHKKADEGYRNAMIEPIAEAQALVASDSASVIWRLLGYIRPYKWQVVAGMSGAVLMTSMSLVPPYLTGRLIDETIKPWQAGTLTIEHAQNSAWQLLALIAVAYLLREIFAWVRLRTMAMMGEWIACDLRTQLYEHIQRLSIRFFSQKQTGTIITRVSSDTDRIWDFIAFGVVEVSISIIMLLGLSSVLLALDWKLGLILTLPIPLFLLAIYWHGETMNRVFLKAWRKWSELTAVLSDTIPGIRVVKAFHQEDQEIRRFDARNRSVTEEFQHVHMAWTTFWPLLMTSVFGVNVLVWYFALPRILSPEPTLTAGVFVSFLFYMTMYVQPIEIIGQMARMLNRATSSAQRIFEVLDTQPDLVEKKNAVVLPAVKGEVRFENVCFGYDGIRQIIKKMNFTVQPGEMVGLVGPSGAGKSTVTQLIARFYDVTSGSIRIDGNDIRHLDLGCYRKQVGMVLQEPYLFHGSVLDNIRYGKENASLFEVVQAAKAANVHDFIGKLPQGYDTIVGEKGHSLSGGERQRVSIARAILHNPKILILDEATSAVDTETERKIQIALDRLVKGRTVFAIAHRLSTLAKADRIFVIDDGEIVEEGTHHDLLNIENGTYKKLCQIQSELTDNVVS